MGGVTLKVTINTMKKLSRVQNSIYDDIKLQFLYHSNKLEGSTFNIQQLSILLDENMIVGEHSIDDVQETINSISLFDFVIDTLGEPMTPRLLREYHQVLKKNTRDEKYGFAGVFKKIPNKIMGVDLDVAQPYEVPERIDELLNNKIKSIKDIADFHQKFEAIHPFQDGNGRIGRYIILKQCIENNIDLIAIDDEYNKEYKNALYEAQVNDNIKPLTNVFIKCQVGLDTKLQSYHQIVNDMNASQEELPEHIFMFDNTMVGGRSQPFSDGYVIIKADKKDTAVEAFKSKYGRGQSDEVLCAEVITDSKRIEQIKNLDLPCHKYIDLTEPQEQTQSIRKKCAEGRK